jgi:Domain of unknown function (DUF4193)
MLPRQMATKKKPKAVKAAPKATEQLDDDLDTDEEPEVDLDEEDALEELDDEDSIEDQDDDDDDIGGLEEEDESGDDSEVKEILTPSPAAVVERTGEGDEEEEEEEPEDEDVEASLDVILKERLVVEDEPEDEEATDQEDKTEGNERVLPKQPDEFVCRSCFLVKHPSQLADKKKMLCRDCV